MLQKQNWNTPLPPAMMEVHPVSGDVDALSGDMYALAREAATAYVRDNMECLETEDLVADGVGKTMELPTLTMFLPCGGVLEHADDGFAFRYMVALQNLSLQDVAISGDEREPEMYGLLLPSTKVVVEEMKQCADTGRVWFHPACGRDGYFESDCIDFDRKSEDQRFAVENGWPLVVRNAPYQVFLKVKVVSVPDVALGTAVYIEDGGQRVEVVVTAARPGFTGGFVLSPGAVGYVCGPRVRPKGFSWTLPETRQESSSSIPDPR